MNDEGRRHSAPATSLNYSDKHDTGLRGRGGIRPLEFLPPDVEAEAGWCREVDAAVQHFHVLLATDAIGHFIRSGRPGPGMFNTPYRLRDSE